MGETTRPRPPALSFTIRISRKHRPRTIVPFPIRFPHLCLRCVGMDAQSPGERTRGIRRAKDFQRVYKACESCRKKKIRCVLDDSRGPAGPPCVRCRREMRECIISTERSTRKRNTKERRASSQQDGQYGATHDTY